MRFDYVPFSNLLSNIVDNRGKTCPTVNEGIPLIATNCIRNDSLYPKYTKVRYVSDTTYATWFRGHPKPNDLLFVTKGSPGRVCFVPDPVDFVVAQDMVAIRANQTLVTPKYLFACLRSPQSQHAIANMHVGTLIPHFKKGDFKKLLLPVPSKKAQEIIGEAYFILSHKIELNRQMNETLEAMARAIFQSWFVDFDPVHAKARGEQPIGMDAATAALFPDSFAAPQPSGGRLTTQNADDPPPEGFVPAGWQYKPIGQYINAVRGLSYKGKFLAKEGTPLHNLNSVYEGGGYKHTGIKYYSGPYKERHLVKSGDLIVTNTEQGFFRYLIGYSALVPERFGSEGLFSHHLYRVRPKEGSPLTAIWLNYLLKTQKYHRLISGYGNGTTVNMLPIDALQKPLIVVPPQQLVQKFTALVRPMLQQRDANINESQTLANLRDTLLPKLMSGQLRLPAATT